MPQRVTSRHSRLSPAALVALDFGLSIRLEASPRQRTLFSGAENLTARELTVELADMVSRLRVRSFALRAALEELTSALMVNVESGFWPLAQRAAQDLGDLLQQARKRQLADAELCLRGAHSAFHLSDLLGQEVR